MSRYRYTSIETDGRRRSGLIEAASQQEALRALQDQGQTPLRVRASSSQSSVRISRKDLANFLADLAALHDAGVPLRRSLDVLAGGASHPRAAALAQLISARLDAGAGLARAARLDQTGDLALASELVRAGEASGRLGETLRFASQLLQRQADFAGRIASALAYPAFLVLLSIGAVIALAAFAGPAIAPLLEESPDSSQGLRAVLAVGNALREHGLIMAGVLAAATAVMIVLARRSPFRDMLAGLRRRLPLVGVIVRDINCGAFGRTLGALLAGGAPAASAIDLAAATAPNSAWRRAFLEAGVRLREGRTVGSALASLSGASPELSRLARVGEASGALGGMISRAGDIAIERALRRMDQAAAMAGPLLILGMGGFTGWLMSVFLGGLSQLGEGAI